MQNSPYSAIVESAQRRLSSMSEEQQAKPEQVQETEESRKSHSIKEDVQEIKKKLDAIHAEKEQWFAKRLEYSQQIKAEIQRIKGVLQERDQRTTAVKEEKSKRNELNRAISEKINAFKVLEEQRKGQEEKGKAGKLERRRNPEEIKRYIMGLEKRIETEGLSFEKEKELMKVINTLKKEYAACEKSHEGEQKIKEFSKEIHGLKKQANEVHKKMQDDAKESQKKHEEMIQSSRLINELKKKEKEAHEKFLELKKQFNDLSEKLKTNTHEMREQWEVQKKKFEKKHKIVEEQKNKTLQEKVKSVEEKIKSGKKVTLTMEDLIVFQGMKEKEERKG